MNDSLGEEVGHSVSYLEDDPLHVLGSERGRVIIKWTRVDKELL